MLAAWPAKAIAFLYEHYYEKLVTLSEKKTHDRKASEDIVQEAFTHIWQKHARLAKRRDIFVIQYVYKIIRNKSIDHFRLGMRADLNLTRYFRRRQQRTEPSGEAELLSAERQEFVAKILATFPHREKQCLQMKFYRNMTVLDIALELRVTPKAVERSITSAYKRFRKYRSDVL